MIAIIDYDTGNLRSVCNALDRIGAEYCLTDDPQVIAKADRVLLPGVGEASTAMAKLQERSLCEVITSLKVPVLGICIGMQLMCRHSEEGDVDCMGIFDADVKKFEPYPEAGVKVPHMGWNVLSNLHTRLFDGLSDGTYVYFVHSFAADVSNDSIAMSSNSRLFSAALNKNNFYGVQFHPEKSGEVGEIILRNFMNL
jgi:glutamine amidotransferase